MHQEARTLVASSLLVQSYRFATVGLLSTVVNYAGNQGALAISGHPELSSALGYLAGVAVGYPLNRKWSFQSTRNGRGAALRYGSVYLATFLLNSVLAGWAHARLVGGESVLAGLPMEYLYYLPVIGVTTLLNFIGCKFFVFRG